MKLTLATTFPAPADHVWALVKQSSTLLFVCKGLLGFERSEHFPQEWREGNREVTRLMFFGYIPAWKHTLTFTRIDDEQRILATEEGGGLVPVWNHVIQVAPDGSKACTYSDEVNIKAGIFTIVVWLYAHIFYRYRQHRWRTLLREIAHHPSDS
ncbi:MULTISPECIES: hypothetical protein [Vreelandella]|uniref:SRPBCC family protein n=1 Tax=Vreelandella gomseomensis TaxID=370766 RepID=A0ABU1G894_9GAMM|nr:MULTISPECIES: hypothetical protein [Halomonas]MDR5873711.1 hypothetical protein [Halomonas gomseomensis]MDR5884968.1 hypothetical protein [Halomonas janggokensis]